MIWKNTTSGPGPERMTNAWLNSLQDQVENTRNALRSFPSGVVWGCEITAEITDSDELVIHAGRGAAIVGGVYHEVSGWEERYSFSGGTAADLPRLVTYIDNDGVVQAFEYEVGEPISWPSFDTKIAGEDVTYDLPILAACYAEEADSTWSARVQDTRNFVRSWPNGETLVVGDLDAGADFENIQQALDYLIVGARLTGTSEDPPRRIPRRILVTKDQELTEPLRVWCAGVTIQGVKNEVEPAEGATTDERVVIRWAYDAVPESDDGALAAGAAIDLTNPAGTSKIVRCASFSDIEIRDLHFMRTGSDVECCIYNPGNEFRLQDCIFGELGGDDAHMFYAVSFSEYGAWYQEESFTGTQFVRVEDNLAFGLGRGLFSYTAAELPDGYDDEGLNPYLVSARVERNYVSIKSFGGANGWFTFCELICNGIDGWNWSDRSTHFYAIDLGIGLGMRQPVDKADPAQQDLLFPQNLVQDNVIEGCLCGIRVGQGAVVRDNAVRGCVLFGVTATLNDALDPPVDGDPGEYWEWLTEYPAWNATPGSAEVIGNHIELSSLAVAPWWRAGVRLEMPVCEVTNNSIVVTGGKGCGVVQGPLDMDDEKQLMAHTAGLYRGLHTIAGNNIVFNPVTYDGQVVEKSKITRQGIGVAMFSTRNRIVDNGIFHARTGIFSTAHSIISHNVISPAVTAIFGWSFHSITGNTIGWFPHTAAGLPFSMKLDEPGGAVMISNNNLLDGNTIVCGADDPAAIDVPAAIHVNDWMLDLFGDEWRTFFDDTVWGSWATEARETEPPIHVRLVGEWAGNNKIANQVIELSKPPILTMADQEDYDVTKIATVRNYLRDTYFNVDGIVLNGLATPRNMDAPNLWPLVQGLIRFAIAIYRKFRPREGVAAVTAYSFDAEDRDQLQFELPPFITELAEYQNIQLVARQVGAAVAGRIPSWIVLSLGSILLFIVYWLLSMWQGKLPSPLEFRTNSVTGTLIWRGLRGIAVESGRALVSDSSAFLSRDQSLDVKAAPDSNMSDSVFCTTGLLSDKGPGVPVTIGAFSQGTSLNDCLIIQAAPAGSREIFAPEVGPSSMFNPVCIEQNANRVSIDDCTIVNLGNAGIHWKGDYGECGGCWFYTRSDIQNPPDLLEVMADFAKLFTGITGGTTTDSVDVENIESMLYDVLTVLTRRYPAICFDHEGSPVKTGLFNVTLLADSFFPAAKTQGNLVHGAHMINSQALLSMTSWIFSLAMQQTGGRSIPELPYLGVLSPIIWANGPVPYLESFIPEVFDPALRGLMNQTGNPWTLLLPRNFDPLYPPKHCFLQNRWTNRVAWQSCFFSAPMWQYLMSQISKLTVNS